MIGFRPFRVTALTLAALITACARASAAPHPPTPPHHAPPANLDAMFAAAVAAPSLRSYSVPVDFNVHVHKPISIRANVAGTAYFKAPAQSALQITHASGLIGGFFKGAYKLDVVPQAWPYTFHVISSTRTITDGRGVQQLTAQPRDPASTITRVIFTLSLPDHEPLTAQWQYNDGSTINLAFTNKRIGPYTLPAAATISVDMPHNKLDADATYNEYAINEPVDETVFEAAK